MFSNSHQNAVSIFSKASNHNIYETPIKAFNASNYNPSPLKILNTHILDFPTSTSKHRQSTPKPSKSSSKKALTPQKSFRRSKSKPVSQKPIIDYKSIPNFDFELKKLLRAVFRHCVACPEFKSELVEINANTLLELYARNRLALKS